MKKYFSLIRAGIIEKLNFRASMIVAFVGNIIYLIIIYFLWKAIYASSGKEVVNQMTFQDTMIYLVLAAAMFGMMEVFLVWMVGRAVQSGTIVLDLLKPMSYISYLFFSQLGEVVVNFVLIFTPTVLIVFFLTSGGIPIGWNLLLFLPAMALGFLINFMINMIVATLCLFTESSWGINIMKEVTVSVLSGASIPLAFFPEPLRSIAEILPFQAVYNTPLQILIHNNFSVQQYCGMFGMQLLWFVILCLIAQFFWRMSLRHITVNGG